MLSPYRVLRIQPGCNEEELRAAYKKRALETHPDKGGNVEEFRSVKTAYEALLKAVPAASNTATKKSEPQSSDVFTPFSRPFPDAFRAATAAGTAAASKVSVSARKQGTKRRRTLEESIEMAFADIPRHARTNRVPKAPPQPKPKPVLQSPKPKPGPKEKAEKAERPERPQSAESQEPDNFAAKLWGRLLQLTLEKRAEAISSLPAKTKERLEAFLKAKKRQRSADSEAETDSEAESETSSGSSSSSSEESEAGRTTANAAPRNANISKSATSQRPDKTAKLQELERVSIQELERLEAAIRSLQDKAQQRGFIKSIPEDKRLALEKHMRSKRHPPAAKQQPKKMRQMISAAQ